jgi:hypothetical protein
VEPLTAFSGLSISTGLVMKSSPVGPDDTEAAEFAVRSGSVACGELYVADAPHPPVRGCLNRMVREGDGGSAMMRSERYGSKDGGRRRREK